MNRIKSVLLAGLFMVNIPFALAQSTKLNQPDQIEESEKQELVATPEAAAIIESYVADFRNDQFASDPIKFGIEVPGKGNWSIQVTGTKTDTGWEVLLNDGTPEEPTFIYVIEHETLLGIYEGNINALTAQGKAFAGDYTPMSVKEMEGYDSSTEEDGKINTFSFHFWTKGFPEIIPFGEGLTRRAHGSNFVVFYYQPGLRTAWYRVLPNEQVRDDPREQAMPFPMLIVAIKGTTKGEVDGKPVSLTEGNTIFIPPFSTHKWWNETDEATEAVLIMFGDGA